MAVPASSGWYWGALRKMWSGMPLCLCSLCTPPRRRQHDLLFVPHRRVTGITSPRVTSAGEPQVPPGDLLEPTGRFPAFASRNYRLFFSGQLVSVTGTWMQTLAQSYLVYDVLHASPFQLGLVNVFQFAP